MFGAAVLLSFLQFLHTQHAAMPECPLDLNGSNFTQLVSVCSSLDERTKCCRYLNAFVTVSMSTYANVSGNLGVPSELSESCTIAVSDTLALNGVAPAALTSCGLGSKIPIAYNCDGRQLIDDIFQLPGYDYIKHDCKGLILSGRSCRRCLNTSISYLHDLVGANSNTTINECRDAVFVALAIDMANNAKLAMSNCFFGVQFSGSLADLSPMVAPEMPPIMVPSAAPVPQINGVLRKGHHHLSHFILGSVISISFIGVALLLLIMLICLMRKKSKKLAWHLGVKRTSHKGFSATTTAKSPEALPSGLRRYSYKETREATGNFSFVIGKGGFGTVYKASFSDGLVAAVKRMDKVSEQGVEEFCREIDLLGKLHHRHLVTLRGFCITKQERFLIYEFLQNGSLKNHLHSSENEPLSWSTRMQIAVGVASALEYLHFYCNPPLCHRDIKSSNILLDEHFVAKLADFGLAYSSKTGSVTFEPISTNIKGTPGYMDPEYVVTHEFTEKSDVYSYGVLLLELITSRQAIHENKNLVEWSQLFMATDIGIHELVDARISNSYNLQQLRTVVRIIKWCTLKEGRARPSIREVLRLLHERLDEVSVNLEKALEEEGYNREKSQRSESIFHNDDGRYAQCTSSMSRSYGSRSFSVDTESP